MKVDSGGRCRLCTITHHCQRAVGNPHWADKPEAAVQLFFGDCAAWAQRSSRLRAGGREAIERPVNGPVFDGAQRQLFPVRLEPEHPSSLALPPVPVVQAVARFGEARGWPPETTTAVMRAMTIVAPGVMPDAALVTELRRLRLPVSRVRELLAADGITTDDRPDAPARWMGEHADALPAPMRAEIGSWVEVIDGRAGRRRTPGTIVNYLRAVYPVLLRWSARCSSLREITSVEVADELGALLGSERVLLAVALRSMFSVATNARSAPLSALTSSTGCMLVANVGRTARTRTCSSARSPRAGSGPSRPATS